MEFASEYALEEFRGFEIGKKQKPNKMDYYHWEKDMILGSRFYTKLFGRSAGPSRFYRRAA